MTGTFTQGVDNATTNPNTSSFTQTQAPTVPSGGNEVVDAISKLEKRLNDKDQFIETLKSERKQDAEQISKLSTMVEQLLTKVEKSNSIAEVVDGLKNQQANSGKTEPVDVKQLAQEAAKLAVSQLDQERNFNDCFQAVKSVYGDDVLTKVRSIATENNMTLEEVDVLAKTKPNVFKKLFTPQSSRSQDPAPANGGVNSQGFKGNPGDSGKKLYRDIRSEKERIAYIQERFKQLAG